MLNAVTTTSTVLFQMASTVHLDPLEQFDVLSLSFPFFGGFGVTNLSLLLAFNVALMAA